MSLSIKRTFKKDDLVKTGSMYWIIQRNVLVRQKILDITSIFIVLFGSTFGLIFRMFIQNNLKINVGFNIQNTSIVNLISSFILGILVSLNFLNNNILLLFYIGFLGCFSTFSSFIYQLLVLFQKRKFMRLFFHYIEVIILSFISFYIGYYLMHRWHESER